MKKMYLEAWSKSVERREFIHGQGNADLTHVKISNLQYFYVAFRKS